MILVIGGNAQGKRKFVEEQLLGGGKICWTEGRNTPREEILKADFCCELHLFLRRQLLEENVSPEELGRLAGELKSRLPGRVIVTDEIGCGIVPMSREERYYREETGRFCCLLAKEADQVWRVTCGLGIRIK